MDRAGTTDGNTVAHLLDDEIFIRRGDYQGNIPRWENAFALEQILFIPFGRILSDLAAVLAEVERHIGIRPHKNYPGLERP